MPQRRSPRLSVNQSKRFTRRIKVIFDWIKRNAPNAFPVFLFFLFLFLVYNLFSVRHVKCSFNSGVCPAEIQTKLDTQIGSNSFLINQKKLSESIKALYPVEKITVGFKMFNTLDVSLVGNRKSYVVDMYLVQNVPPITLDTAPGSSGAADWPRPTQEISTFLSDLSGSSFNVWDNGSMTPVSTSSSTIKYVINEKPDAQTVSWLYNLLKLSFKYLNPSEIYILNNRVFLRQPDQPDIIVNIPFDEVSLTEAFQSISYLATIKKDAKVIDLRFKNPIIR